MGSKNYILFRRKRAALAAAKNTAVNFYGGAIKKAMPHYGRVHMTGKGEAKFAVKNVIRRDSPSLSNIFGRFP